MSGPLPTRPFESCSADLYEVGRLHVLVYCCRFTGFPVLFQWFHDPTAREVMDAVTKVFADMGMPTRLRLDGGPQFKAHAFQEMLKKWGVVWGPSSAHYPKSNGHAEAAVIAAKDLVIKEAAAGDLNSDTFRQALLEFRNTPRACGKSPAEMLFGHQLRSIVPAHWSAFDPRRHEGPNPGPRYQTLVACWRDHERRDQGRPPLLIPNQVCKRQFAVALSPSH
jgi:hypothetical protein